MSTKNELIRISVRESMMLTRIQILRFPEKRSIGFFGKYISGPSKQEHIQDLRSRATCLALPFTGS